MPANGKNRGARFERAPVDFRSEHVVRHSRSAATLPDAKFTEANFPEALVVGATVASYSMRALDLQRWRTRPVSSHRIARRRRGTGKNC
jgi:hypothetical protein